jgi:hypothetical protein
MRPDCPGVDIFIHKRWILVKIHILNSAFHITAAAKKTTSRYCAGVVIFKGKK